MAELIGPHIDDGLAVVIPIQHAIGQVKVRRGLQGEGVVIQVEDVIRNNTVVLVAGVDARRRLYEPSISGSGGSSPPAKPGA